MRVIESLDEVIGNGMSSTTRVISWFGGLLMGAVGFGIAVATFIGLPSRVGANTTGIEILAQNQRELVRIVTTQQCHAQGLNDFECDRLKRRNLETLEDPEQETH